MAEQRRYKRYRVDLHEINGKLSLVEKVEILDISQGGVSLKADRRLNFGKEVTLKLGDRLETIDVKGTVVRSEVSGMKPGPGGENILVYSVALMFKQGQEETVAEFIRSLEQIRKEQPQKTPERRLTVRFSLATPETGELLFPAQFKVKVISLGGMLIAVDQALKINSTVPLSLSLNAHGAIHFTGRVASCTVADEKKPSTYEIGLEFIALTDADRALLKTFVDYLEASQNIPGPGKT
jgi:c-di-GMP-binding flagellar brake protein YcgR